MKTCHLFFVLLINSLCFCVISAAKNEKWSYSNPNVFMEEGLGCSLMTHIDCKVVGGNLDGEDCLDISPNIPFLKFKESDCPLEPISAKVTFEICNIGTHNSLILDEKKTVMRLDKIDVTPSWIFQNPLDPEKCITYSEVRELNGCGAYEDAGITNTNLPIYVRVKAFSEQKRKSTCKCSTFRTSSYKIEDTEMKCTVKKAKSGKAPKSEKASSAPSTSRPSISDKLLKDDYNVTLAAVHFSNAAYKKSQADIQGHMENRGYSGFEVIEFFNEFPKEETWDTQASVGVHNAHGDSGNHIFVAFRGSDFDNLGSFLNDWFTTDLNALPARVIFDDENEYPDNIFIHEGFRRALVNSGVLKDVESHVIDLLQDEERDLSGRVIITGHSLGGSLAQLFSVYMAHNHPKYDFEMITFGAPKVSFGTTFKKWAEAMTNLSMWRLVYDNDAAARFPPDSSGYKHTGHTFQIYPRFTETQKTIRGSGKSKAFYRHDGNGNEQYRSVSQCWYFPSVLGFNDHKLDYYIVFLDKNAVNPYKSPGNDYWPRWFQEKKDCKKEELVFSYIDWSCQRNIRTDECFDTLI